MTRVKETISSTNTRCGSFVVYSTLEVLALGGMEQDDQSLKGRAASCGVDVYYRSLLLRGLMPDISPLIYRGNLHFLKANFGPILSFAGGQRLYELVGN